MSNQQQRPPFMVYRRRWRCGCEYIGQSKFTPEERDSAPYDSGNPAVVAHGRADGYEVIDGASTKEDVLKLEAQHIAAAAAASPGGWGCAPGRLLNIEGNPRAGFDKRPTWKMPSSEVRPGLVLDDTQAVVCVCDRDDPGCIVTGGMDPRGATSLGALGRRFESPPPTVKAGGRVPAVPDAAGEMYRRAVERAMDQLCDSCPNKDVRDSTQAPRSEGEPGARSKAGRHGRQQRFCRGVGGLRPPARPVATADGRRVRPAGSRDGKGRGADQAQARPPAGQEAEGLAAAGGAGRVMSDEAPRASDWLLGAGLRTSVRRVSEMPLSGHLRDRLACDMSTCGLPPGSSGRKRDRFGVASRLALSPAPFSGGVGVGRGCRRLSAVSPG